MRQYDNPLYSVVYDYPSHQGIVLNGLNTLRKRDQLLDVTLIVQGQKFKAHKVVLSACSDYFRAMFTDNMIEANSKEIQLNGITAAGFSLVLQYAYTCRITLDLSNVQDVLETASHVQMLALIQTCSNYLEAEIDVDNCVDIATIAETYSLMSLRMEVYRFMNENLTKFSETGEFYRLSATQLTTLLAYDFPVDCSEYDVLKSVVNWFSHNANTGSKLDLCKTAPILRHIHFCDIPRNRIQSILAEIIEKNHFQWEVYKLLVSEIYHQISSRETKQYTNLLNARGMEPAVLKIGGFGSGGITNEITFKFASKSEWKHLTEIPHVEQCNFGTAVLNNDLFIIGGCFNQGMQENVHPFGFKYSTLHDKWTSLSPMQVERCRFSLNVVAGKMYAVGGVAEVEEFGSNLTTSCECYDPGIDEWSLIEHLPVFLTQHAGAAYEPQNSTPKLFICGGIERDTTHCQNSMYCYDILTNRWSQSTPMLTPRADHVILSIDNFLYVCGGWQEDSETGFRTLVDTIDMYDVENDVWRVRTRVPTPRFHAGIVCIFRKIYFIGGFHSDNIFDRCSADIECYDIDKDRWSKEDKYPGDIWEHTCALLYVPKCRNGSDVASRSTNIP